MACWRRSPGWSSTASRARRRSLAACTSGASSASLTALSQNFRHLFFFRAAEGLGETFYFPASMSLISDYHGRATRSRAMGLHQTSVYVGTIGGGFFAGLIGQHYGWRLSFIVFGSLGVLLGCRPALAPRRAAPRRGGARGSGRRQRARGDTSPALVRRVPAPPRPHADALVPDGRVHVRELRRRRAPVLDAEIPLRQVPDEPGDVGPDRHALRAARQHGRRAARRLAGRRLAAPLAARTPGGPDDRRPRRRAVRRALRPDAVGRRR